ncbi:hypothetical protein [Microbacterium sp.]|uniref:hypothetical protein n=1 Tax=Microbacterium sp. TaxID=51671 RepID=UPI00257FF4D7|nr:hypothetical protein [Microbacterium sp.]
MGASAKLQGAELIRTDEAQRLVDLGYPNDADTVRNDAYCVFYDRMTIVNVDLRDLD